MSRRHPTNAADQAEGVVSVGSLQLSGDVFTFFAYSIGVGVVLWTLSVLFLDLGFWVAVGLGVSPALLTFCYILLFVHGRPPRFAADLFQVLIEGNGISCPSLRFQPDHPLSSHEEDQS